MELSNEIPMRVLWNEIPSAHGRTLPLSIILPPAGGGEKLEISLSSAQLQLGLGLSLAVARVLAASLETFPVVVGVGKSWK